MQAGAGAQPGSASSSKAAAAAPAAAAAAPPPHPRAPASLRTCRRCKQQFDPATNGPSSCRYHSALWTGEARCSIVWQCRRAGNACFAITWLTSACGVVLLQEGRSARLTALCGRARRQSTSWQLSWGARGLCGERRLEPVLLLRLQVQACLTEWGSTSDKQLPLGCAGCQPLSPLFKECPPALLFCRFWDCCGAEDEDAPGCCTGRHVTYDDPDD